MRKKKSGLNYNIKMHKSKMGQLCEYYINNPDETLVSIGKKFNVCNTVVSDIIELYLGNGKPVLMSISGD